MRLLGMDEAGRGCVLGPLVVGAFLLEGDDQGVLKAAGATDSKVLSAKKRAEVRARLVDLGVSDLERVSARQMICVLYLNRKSQRRKAVRLVLLFFC